MCHTEKSPHCLKNNLHPGSSSKKELKTFFFLFWPHCMVCGTLVTQPRIEPGPSAMKVWSPNHWIAGKSLDTVINTIWKNTITTKTFKNDAKRLRNVKQSGKVYSQIFDYVSFLADLVNKCLLNPKHMHVAILYSERGKKKKNNQALLYLALNASAHCMCKLVNIYSFMRHMLSAHDG